MMTESEIKNRVRAAMSEKRFRHTLGCASLAKELALRWGADENAAYTAGLLHDITKEIPYEEQLKLVCESGIILDRLQKSEKIIHAFTGAVVAGRDFGASEEICGAIRWHTTAKAGMTLLEKIIWLSDIAEEGRVYDDAREIRRLSFEDLSKALIYGFDVSLRVLMNRGSEIDINMVEARNYELSLKK